MTNLVVIPVDELRDLLSEAVRAGILSATVEFRPEPPLMTKHEAAKFLRVDISTIARLMRDPDFPVCRVGGSVRFNKKELEEWMRR